MTARDLWKWLWRDDDSTTDLGPPGCFMLICLVGLLVIAGFFLMYWHPR